MTFVAIEENRRSLFVSRSRHHVVNNFQSPLYEKFYKTEFKRVFYQKR